MSTNSILCNCSMPTRHILKQCENGLNRLHTEGGRVGFTETAPHPYGWVGFHALFEQMSMFRP